MSFTRNRLYSITFLACLAGWLWLLYHRLLPIEANSVNACFIKAVTGYPCPSCGTTRAVAALTQGKVVEALMLNPFGLVVMLIMVIAPVWIARDAALRSDSFWRFYVASEKRLSRPAIAIGLLLLVVANWIWNISKGY
jgi:hypothetical protein